jgi:hypothetical protein
MYSNWKDCGLKAVEYTFADMHIISHVLRWDTNKFAERQLQAARIADRFKKTIVIAMHELRTSCIVLLQKYAQLQDDENDEFVTYSLVEPSQYDKDSDPLELYPDMDFPKATSIDAVLSELGHHQEAAPTPGRPAVTGFAVAAAAEVNIKDYAEAGRVLVALDGRYRDAVVAGIAEKMGLEPMQPRFKTKKFRQQMINQGLAGYPAVMGKGIAFKLGRKGGAKQHGGDKQVAKGGQERSSQVDRQQQEDGEKLLSRGDKQLGGDISEPGAAAEEQGGEHGGDGELGVAVDEHESDEEAAEQQLGGSQQLLSGGEKQQYVAGEAAKQPDGDDEQQQDYGMEDDVLGGGEQIHKRKKEDKEGKRDKKKHKKDRDSMGGVVASQ